MRPSSSAGERQRLVDAHVPFVRSVAAKVKEQLPREIEFDDLVAYGMQGLLEAADRYDPAHGTAFTTFAYYRVRGAMFDGLRRMGWLPRAAYARQRLAERAGHYLQNLQDRDLGEARLEDGGGVTLEDEVRALSEALGGVAAIFVTTLDACGREREPASEDPSPSVAVEARERSQAVRQALSCLPPKERRLLQLYYYEDKSITDAGASMGLSKSWTSRLHARAIALLKEALERVEAPSEDAEPKRR